MRATDAPETNPVFQQDRAEAAERASLAAEAERVMNESRPTPSQAEIDAIKTGKMAHDDKEALETPQMPPLHEQHARIASARNPRRRRDVVAEDDHAAYRTRQVAADRPDTDPPAPHAAPLPRVARDVDKK